MIIEALERELPPATLLLGPDLEQMLRAAVSALQKHHVVYADLITSWRLSAAEARGLVKFAGTAPFGSFKAVIAGLDGATAQAQNILLKVLEEPPPSIRFILAATARPLPTIVSRCQVITVPAARLERESTGEVAGTVAVALSAAATGDLAALDKALTGWGDTHHAVLSMLLAEAASGRGVPGLTQVQARRLLGALGRFDGAHPRLAAHAALVSILSDRENHA